MGNALATQPSQIIIEEDDPLLRDYKRASVKDYHAAKENFDTLQATVGDKMAVTLDEFDEIFSLICQDAAEHFELFDCWELGKVDVMEVFAVVIVYCKAPIETKVPLLFDLFDFDHSGEISEYELVLLLLCATRGLCKVVGLDRPGTEELEELAKSAFVSIDRDHSGAISLNEFADWALQEPSLLLYLKRFAATRLIYENQLEYDALLKQLCSSFVQFAIHVGADASASSVSGSQQLTCSAGTCKEIIKLHCPSTEEREVDYLVRAMVDTMKRRGGGSGGAAAVNTTKTHAVELAATAITTSEAEAEAMIDSSVLPQMVSMDVFCMISASYAAFIVADEDKQHVLDTQELLILLWLLRGKEPSPQIVASYMKSLDRDQNGVLSALEWVTFAIENDTRTGSLSFATQLQLLFTHADRNGDAMLSLYELCMGLKPIVLQSLVAEEAVRVTAASADSRAPAAVDSSVLSQVRGVDHPVTPLVATFALEKKLQEYSEVINDLIAELANELMQALDKNQSHRIEWYEFRQQLDYLEDRVSKMKAYITDFVLT